MGSRIKELRKREKMVQSDIAEIVSASQQSVSQWEKEPKTLPLDVVCKLADYFQVSVDYLLERTDMVAFPNEYYNELIEKIARLSLEDQYLVTVLVDILSQRNKQ